MAEVQVLAAQLRRWIQEKTDIPSNMTTSDVKYCHFIILASHEGAFDPGFSTHFLYTLVKTQNI